MSKILFQGGEKLSRGTNFAPHAPPLSYSPGLNWRNSGRTRIRLSAKPQLCLNLNRCVVYTSRNNSGDLTYTHRMQAGM